MMGREAEFVKSCAGPDDFPATGFPEVAFVGRSNVGKSSLMNLLLGRKQLVKVSRTPGKTQTINFFSVAAHCYFVDLPGYGYARVPQSVQASWKGLIESYLAGRRTLRGAVLVLDPRRPPTALDCLMRDWLKSFGIPIIHVATKSDQLSSAQRSSAMQSITATWRLVGEERPCFVSAKTGEGKRELWARLDRLLRAG